jgi:hypothetical protein
VALDVLPQLKDDAMGDKKIRAAWTIAGLILLIVVAVVLITRQATAPRETINDFHKIPPKGAGRYDRN